MISAFRDTVRDTVCVRAHMPPGGNALTVRAGGRSSLSSPRLFVVALHRSPALIGDEMFEQRWELLNRLGEVEPEP